MFELANAARRLTAQTRRRYAWELQRFALWCQESSLTHIHEVQPAHLRAYNLHINQRTSQRGREMASSTVHGWLRTLRRFWNFCVEEELLELSPFRKIRMPRVEVKVLPSLSPDEVQAVLRACETTRDRALISFIIDTGVRADELCKLNMGDLDFATGAVLVKGKGQKERTVYAGATVRKLVRRYIVDRRKYDVDAPLFAGVKAIPGQWSRAEEERLKPNSLVLLMRRLRDRTGVKHLTAHALRRTFAITCLRNGMDVFTLKELMGHADLTILNRYLRLVQADLQRAHERHSPMDNL